MEININQKNIFGGNSINIIYPTDRELTADLKNQILKGLKKFNVNSVVLQFDYDQETKVFIDKIASFFRNERYAVFGENDNRFASGIKRREFSISKHPSDPNFAIVRVGGL